jgi:3-deoxy-D-manno-octulosonate 8-phosphate phosphatase (KDO 8-P phosphatase)
MGWTNLQEPSRANLEALQLLVLDVDGVLTDGRICIDSAGGQFKQFDVQDGAGIKYWQRCGKRVAIISGRSCGSVVLRAAELGVALLRQNQKNKLPAYLAVLAETGMKPEQVAVIGDDLPDVPLMRRCGLAIAPANAVVEAREAAGLITAASGGRGAVREAIEFILRRTGQWDDLLKRYFEASP